MARRLLAVLVAALVTAGMLAPSAVVLLDAAGHAPAACCREQGDDCHEGALRRPCCPCAAPMPGSGPSVAQTAPPAPASLTPAPWAALPPSVPDESASAAARAFLTARLSSAHDPPWLLHLALLI